MSYIGFIRSRCIGVALTLIIVTVASGCGGQKLYPVEGRVIFPDGTPLAGGLVVFEPIESTTNVSARGQIQADGTFRLGTFRDDDGAIAGRHRALVAPPLPARLDERNPAPPPIHARFRNFTTSGLEFLVTTSTNKFIITVEKP
jgi:hypothetical protein